MVTEAWLYVYVPCTTTINELEQKLADLCQIPVQNQRIFYGNTQVCFNYANYSPSIAMELKISKEIKSKIMTKSEIQDKQICFPSIIFEAASSTGINFEKLLG